MKKKIVSVEAILLLSVASVGLRVYHHSLSKNTSIAIYFNTVIKLK